MVLTKGLNLLEQVSDMSLIQRESKDTIIITGVHFPIILCKITRLHLMHRSTDHSNTISKYLGRHCIYYLNLPIKGLTHLQ